MPTSFLGLFLVSTALSLVATFAVLAWKAVANRLGLVELIQRRTRYRRLPPARFRPRADIPFRPGANDRVRPKAATG